MPSTCFHCTIIFYEGEKFEKTYFAKLLLGSTCNIIIDYSQMCCYWKFENDTSNGLLPKRARFTNMIKVVSMMLFYQNLMNLERP